MSKRHTQSTTVGHIAPEVLAYTAGRDIELDRALVEWDCLGSAAHATMLSRIRKPRLFSAAERGQVVKALADIVKQAAAGCFEITLADQDVHLAVERVLTERLGDLGKRIHTGRSRNDQVALDLRLYGKDQLLGAIREAATLARTLIRFGEEHVADPMVGRTHMQPAMPSSVGLWATAHAESLLDDAVLLINAYELNDQCPLGFAAGYGVPLPIDRALVSDLLGFSRPVHNVLYAGNARGKIESIVLHAMSQVMLTLSRLAQDLIVFSLPEMAYFTLPRDFCTGSSIMPQKSNPDVLELVRAKAARVSADASLVQDILRGSLSGYNRDLQETKEPFMDGIAVTRATLRVLAPLIEGTQVDREALLEGFTPDVFATDAALELVAGGMPFRDAYHHVKEHLDDLAQEDPRRAILRKTHLGATAGLDFEAFHRRADEALIFARNEETAFHKTASKLLGIPFPVAPAR